MITGPLETLKRARKLRSEMSLPEMVLWRHLRTRPGGFKFRRQHPAGEYILDFFCASVRLAIEVDGAVHDGAVAVKRDERRSAALRSQQVATLRIPARSVFDDAEAVLMRIVDICRERAARIASLRGPAAPPVPIHQPAAGPRPRSGEVQENI